jgi:hypothetical protein
MTRREDLILEIWERLDCESVGAAELQQIQVEVEERLGLGAVESPAAIARMLADEGATLRHPEVLEFDTQWRVKRLSEFNALDFSTLEHAAAGLRQIEAWRKQFGPEELARLYDFVVQIRDQLSFNALDKNGEPRALSEAKEIAEWLSLWRNSPDLFPDWLELRLASPGFKSLFPDFKNAKG